MVCSSAKVPKVYAKQTFIVCFSFILCFLILLIKHGRLTTVWLTVSKMKALFLISLNGSHAVWYSYASLEFTCTPFLCAYMYFSKFMPKFENHCKAEVHLCQLFQSYFYKGHSILPITGDLLHYLSTLIFFLCIWKKTDFQDFSGIPQAQGEIGFVCSPTPPYI